MDNLRILYDYKTPFQIANQEGKPINKFIRLDATIDSYKMDVAFIKQALTHTHSLQESFIAKHHQGKSLTKKLTPTRGIVSGVGEPSVHAVGFKMHHLWGIPYLPASSWQGVIRHWIIKMAFEGNEEAALKDPAFLYLFGSTDQKGNITFLDAYPLTLDNNNLFVSGKTPHHSAYYTNKETPTDNKNPVPILFLTVQGVSWMLRMVDETKYGNWSDVIKSSALSKAPNADTALGLLKEQLPNIFRYFGVGSNTHNGYGKGELTDLKT